MPQFGGDQHGDVELDPEAVEININIFDTGSGQTLVNEFCKFPAALIGRRGFRDRSGQK